MFALVLTYRLAALCGTPYDLLIIDEWTRMMWQKLAVLCGALVVTACGGDGPSEPEAPVQAATESTDAPAIANTAEEDAGLTIVMLGDSLTAGFGLPDTSDGLPEQTEARLRASGHDVSFINAGVSGDTTSGGLSRYDWSVASANPDMLIVALGANDYLQGQDPSLTRANLSAIIERAQSAGLAVLLVSVGARSDAISDPRALAFAEIYPDLAATYGVPHLQGMLEDIRDNADLLLGDGLHPTAEGIGLIADRLSIFVADNLPAAD
ncbi:MAG: arylesterase [Pseudomonadota bacterium]